MTIKQLPPEVIAQIKSSSIITSLNSVVLGLIRNSLDAKATKVNVSIDFRLGNCSVEDNGSGIPGTEFKQGGGLGNLHFTSKFPRKNGVYGHSGSFLFSVASLSLLSIASHHRLQNSHNCMTIHNSEIVSRHVPALPEQRLLTFPHGTRVTVRDLFGSMPVRVKQRALETERSGSVRDWDQLVRRVVSLLLAFPGEVAISLRDSNSTRNLNFRIGSTTPASKAPKLLARASLWDETDDKSWVPLGASSPGVTVQGCVSLIPTATKRLQFISFGIEPLSDDHGSNVLFEEVNKVFAHSRFGTVEDDRTAINDSVQHEAGQSREYTATELKIKKGIDRWPAFYLQITLEDLDLASAAALEDVLLEGRNISLLMVVDLLKAMAYTFLKKHHFSPHHVKLSSRTKGRTLQSHTKRSASLRGVSDGDTSGSSTRHSTSFENPTNALQIRHKRVRTDPANTGNSPAMSTDVLFADTDSPANLKPGRLSTNDTESRENCATASVDNKEITAPIVQASNSPSVDKSSGEDSAALSQAHQCATTQPEHEPIDHGTTEGTFQWENPATKVRSLVDARTGFIIEPRPSSAQVGQTRKWKQLSGKPAQSEPSPWLKDVLSRFKDPVFEKTEPTIPRLSDIDMVASDAPGGNKHRSSCCLNFGHNDDKTSLTLEGRLSKATLQLAEVVAQVDQKFILAKVPTSLADEAKSSGLLLVLIDQHAADERCRVEALMRNYFETTGPNSNKRPIKACTEAVESCIRIDLSTQNCDLLVRFKPHFARWGVLYEVCHAVPTVTSQVQGDNRSRERRVLVSSLPPAILERCRSEPNLLVEMLRGEALRLVGDQSLARAAMAGAAIKEHIDGSADQHGWVSRFHGCPPGILDLINSRACRSAIMFGDLLSVEECRELVNRLSDCAFPFQCAHGRPSMVPLLDLGCDALGVDPFCDGDVGDYTGGFLSQFGQKPSRMRELGG